VCHSDSDWTSLEGDGVDTTDLQETPRFIERFGGSAGAPNQTYHSEVGMHFGPNARTPFQSEMEWEIARWAKLRGLTATAINDLLSIDGVRHGCLVF
jgi:hypothetical protein